MTVSVPGPCEVCGVMLVPTRALTSALLPTSFPPINPTRYIPPSPDTTASSSTGASSWSSAGAGEKEFNRWIDSLRYRNATVHAIVLNVKDGRGLPDIDVMAR